VRVELWNVFCYSFDNGPLKSQLCVRAFGYWRRNVRQAPDKHAKHNLSFESVSMLYVNHGVLLLVHRARALVVTLLIYYCRKHCSITPLAGYSALSQELFRRTQVIQDSLCSVKSVQSAIDRPTPCCLPCPVQMPGEGVGEQLLASSVVML
jgi:hypothetical protein